LKKKDYPRDYRKKYNKDLYNYSIVIDESDLFIKADRMLASKAYDYTKRHRQEVIDYIDSHPSFKETLSPFFPDDLPMGIIRSMIMASSAANVGPMASIAGAIAEYVGKDLLRDCNEVIIENGGDIFLKAIGERTIGTLAGSSAFSDRVFFTIDPEITPIGICTSSGTIGRSFSYGNADAVTVISGSATLADAFATSICNMVKKPSDIEKALECIKGKPGLLGAVVIMGDEIGIWGNLMLMDKNDYGDLLFKVFKKK